ncbi:MAG TPA: hypothetical protein VGQ62_21500 [Chloroflexota bacterium]|jgi:hypothetical protein|nr:hypothetical protein [Chloroflexota bacterium]
MIPQPVVDIVGRAIRQPVVHATALLASMPVASAGLNAFGVTSDLKTLDMARSLVDPNLWLCLGIVALFGAVGGVVAELLSLHGNIELPHRGRHGGGAKRTHLADPRYEIDLGIFSRLILGSTAALALLALYVPTSPTALIVYALIAGSAGTGVFRLAQGRILGKAQKDKDEAQSAKALKASKTSAGALKLAA